MKRLQAALLATILLSLSCGNTLEPDSTTTSSDAELKGAPVGPIIRHPIKLCRGTAVSPDLATDGQRVYMPAATTLDTRVMVRGYRYNDAPPTKTRPEGEGKEQIFCGCQRVRLEEVWDPDGVRYTLPFIVVPEGAPTGDYSIQPLAGDGECNSGGLRAVCPDTGCASTTLSVAPSFITSATQRILFNGNSEDDSDNPSETAFAFAGRSGVPFGDGDSLVEWSGSFPGGTEGSAHITNADNTNFNVKLPLFVGRESTMREAECREECASKPASGEAACLSTCDANRGLFNDRLQFAINGVEYDSSPSKWWGYLAGAATTALGCYASYELGIPKKGCVGSAGFFSTVADTVNGALADDDDNLGASNGEHLAGFDWGIGASIGPIDFAGPTRTNGDLDLFYSNRRTAAPRILAYNVKLKSVKVISDYEESSCGSPNEVFVNARAMLNRGDTQLPGTTRFPATGTWSLRAGETQTVDATIASATFTPETAQVSPWLYVELGVWEDDEDKDLMGLEADTIFLGDVLGGQYTSTTETTAEGFYVRKVKFDRVSRVHGYAGSDNHCWGIWSHGWNPQAIEGSADITYEVELTWLKAPPR
jgi:hypothetical protein